MAGLRIGFKIFRVLCLFWVIIALLLWAMDYIQKTGGMRYGGIVRLSHDEDLADFSQVDNFVNTGVHVDQSVQWTPRMDVLSAKEAAKYQNVFAQLSYRDTTVELEEPMTVYSVGEVIRVKITVKFKSGNMSNHGGDKIRIHMTEHAKGASVSGYVIDHHNGSYTGVLTALWEGECIIMTALKYTRYEIAYLYHSRQKLLTVRWFYADFISGERVVSSPCYSRPNSLQGSNGYCNLTEQNADLPWFCQVPKKTNMTCKQLHHIRAADYDEAAILSRTRPNSRVWSTKDRVLGQHISITVQGSIYRKQQNDKPLCSKYNLSALWKQPSPTGHFYQHHWYPYHCRAASVAHSRCVKNTYFIFYGDSTVLQWYTDMDKRFNCTQYPVKGEERLYMSKCHDQNMILYPSRHNFPINTLKLTPEVNLVCDRLEDLFDMVDVDYLPVVIVHIYLHYAYSHHNVYRERIRHLRTTLETILRKRPDAKIVIKSPYLVRIKTIGVNDYYAYIYRLILLEELSPLRNKIIYLDQMDISNAANSNAHPSEQIVRELVNHMLAYICE